MADRSPITVIVATHDRPGLLAGALRSLAAALGPADELVVVESGDSDAAALVAEVSGPSAVLVRSAERGKSAKLNRAVARTGVDRLLLFTDDDVEVDPGWPAAMAEPFADPGVVAAFGPVRGLSAHGGADPAPVPAGDAPAETWAFAHGASMAVRAAALWDVGGFDERLGPGAPAHGEEHDLVLRLREAGGRVVVAAAPAVAHVGWRSAPEDAANLLVYERGAGAYVGAALRRRRGRALKPALLRLRFEAGLVRGPGGAELGRAFAGGLAYGLRLAPRRWLPKGP